MKNDFDFIKDKFENSGVNAPEDMSASYALDQIAEVQPKPTAVPKKSKKKIAAIAAAAASFVLVAAIGAAVGVNLGRKNHVSTLDLPGGLSLRTFSDRSEVEKVVKDIQKERNKVSFGDVLEYGAEMLNGSYAAADSAKSADAAGSGSADTGSSTMTSSAGEAHSDTYIQVDGVDEADIIKTDGRYIYAVDAYDSSHIKIFAAVEGDNAPIADLNVSDSTVATPDEARDFDYYGYYLFNINDFYLHDDRLIVMCNDNNFGDSGYKTVAKVYDISDINNITLLGDNAQSGSYTASRMIGDTVYTVSSYYPNSEKHILPVCGNAENPAEIPCDCIYSYQEPQSENFLVVSAFNTADFTARTESKAILGAAQDIYCNQNHLYIFGTQYANGDARYYWGYADDGTTSQILKLDLTADLSFTAYAQIAGYIHDQYALDEKDGNLRVATTSSKNGHDVNNLFVLDENLGVLGSVNGFALNESIKAVRYIGDTAYVITYERTDPLFVIDLSTPTAPKIMGEVKITGFSTMLVPIDENTLLGVGLHTEEEDYTDLEVQEGVKLALFDVSDPANPQVLDSKSYVDCFSAVTYNPRALVYNPDRDDYVIPLNYYHYDYTYNSETDEYVWGENEEQYGGMLNFAVRDGKLVEIDRYRAGYTFDVERCVYVGSNVYMTHHTAGGGFRLDSTPYR